MTGRWEDPAIPALDQSAYDRRTFTEHAPSPDTSLDNDSDGPAYRKPFPLGFAPPPRHRGTGSEMPLLCTCPVYTRPPHAERVWVLATIYGNAVLWRTLNPLCEFHHEARHRA